MMKQLLCVVLVGLMVGVNPALAAAGATPRYVHDPYTPGYPPAKDVNLSADDLAKLNAALQTLLANSDPAAKIVLDQHPNASLITAYSANPPVNADGNFIVGPNYVRAPELSVQPGVPQGKVFTFTMNSTDSKIYPGIDRDAGTNMVFDPDNLYTVLVPTSHPAPYTRQVWVYVPSQYVPGTPAPFIIGTDGSNGGDTAMFNAVNNLIAAQKLPVMIVISVAHGGRRDSDAQGSQRGLEYDTMSGLYAEFIESEVLPLVESTCNVKLTKDPEGRATTGGSSGGSCALIMAWYHPEWYHRVLTYSGTYVNQQWPFNPETPHGAWGFHETIIPNSPVKPLRIWMEVGDNDLLDPNVMLDHMHEWVVANENMATVLAAKGYHYQFVFARGAGHVDGNTRNQTLPEALEWLWQGYPIEPAK